MNQHQPRATGTSFPRLIAGSLLLVFVVCSLAIAPTLIWILPQSVRDQPVTSLTLATALLFAALSRMPDWFAATRFPRLKQWLARSESIGDWVLGRALLPVLLGASLIYFLVWLPHFLLTPWSRDSDTFASLALSWNAGVVPYRDIVGYNFPGHIYFFWWIGTTLGWGQTWGLHLVDASFLLLFVAALIVWSHRIFHSAIPGSMSLILVLMYYTRLDFQLYAQRDWHATLAIASSILVAEAWPARRGRVASALLAAVAFSIRPHVVFFLPAIFSALHESALTDIPKDGPRSSLWTRPIVDWTIHFTAFSALAFVPLLLAGALPGLIGGLNHYVLSGAYGRGVDPSMILTILSDTAASPQTRIELPLLALMAAFARGRYRSCARTWLLVVIGALVYRIPHPVQHNYLSFPFFMMRMLAVAPVAAWLLQTPALASVSKLAALGALGASSLIFPARLPEFRPALTALTSISLGQSIPVSPPPGALSWYHEAFPQWYSWKDYRSTLLYLREHTTANTVVANVLRSPPFPAINGPAGRRSPFRTESGLCWIWFINEDRDAQFAGELETEDCDVVVWTPGDDGREPRMRLPQLCAAIRQSFEREAQFGRIEIWRRKHHSP